MLNIPEEVKALCRSDGVRKNFRVEFLDRDLADLTNEDILTESVSFTESLCSREKLKFGVCEASCISFEAMNIPNIKGARIKCGLDIDCSSLIGGFDWIEHRSDLDYPSYYIPYGIFAVDSCQRNSDTNQRNVMAYSEENVTDFGVPPSLQTLYWYTTFATEAERTLNFTIDDLLDLTFPSYSMSRHTLETYVDDYPSITYELDNEYTLSLHYATQVLSYASGGKCICTYRIEYDKKLHDAMINNVSEWLTTEGYEIPTEFLKSFVCDYVNINNAYSVITKNKQGQITSIVGGNKDTVNNLRWLYDVEGVAVYIDSLPHTLLKISEYKSVNTSTGTTEYVSGCELDPYKQTPPIRDYGGRINIPYSIRLFRGTEVVNEWKSGNYVEGCLEDIGQGEIIYSISPTSQLRNMFKYNPTTGKTIGNGYRTDMMYHEAVGQMTDDKWRNLIESCIELKGCLGHFNRYGYFELKKLDIPNNIYPKDTLYPAFSTYPSDIKGTILNSGMYSSAWFDDYPTKPLRKVSATYKVNNRAYYKEVNIPVEMLNDELLGKGVFYVNKPNEYPFDERIYKYYHAYCDVKEWGYTYDEGMCAMVIESTSKILAVEFYDKNESGDTYFEEIAEPNNRVVIDNETFLQRLSDWDMPIIGIESDGTIEYVDATIYILRKETQIFADDEVSAYDVSSSYFANNDNNNEKIEWLLETVASNIEGVQYTPSNVECIGLPYIETGDWITVISDKNGFDSLILSRTLKGVQSLKDSYESKGE